MTRRAALAALLLLAAGCVHYPTVMETGGVRIRTENGRAVRQGGDLVVTFDVVSSGKYGDTITGVVAPLAKQAVLVRGGGGAAWRSRAPPRSSSPLRGPTWSCAPSSGRSSGARPSW